MVVCIYMHYLIFLFYFLFNVEKISIKDFAEKSSITMDSIAYVNDENESGMFEVFIIYTT